MVEQVMDFIEGYDKEIGEAIKAECGRQRRNLELIASENIVSEPVMAAMGTVLTNKYAEGYSGKRYYGGCEFVDVVETIAIERAKKLFGCDYVNVQPHSGAQANMAVFVAMLKPGDTVMGMNLDHGGHLTHGSPVNFSGLYFNIVPYGVNEDGYIDYDKLEETAVASKPKLIIAGASAYCRTIDFKRFREVADKVGAYLMVDMAHIAGLVAAGVHPSPIPYADVVTTTTHKTLRGPRGGMILANQAAADKFNFNKAIFPGIQGGPLEHVIAAKAVCFGEALRPEFKAYQEQVVKNAEALAAALKRQGFNILTGNDTVIRWMGVGAAMVNCHGTCIMIDPMLKDAKMPMLIDFPITVEQIPYLDGILVTHIDRDHYSLPTCLAVHDRCKEFHTTQYVASEMQGDGINGIGHDIGGRFTIGPMHILVTPADHCWQNQDKRYKNKRLYVPEDYCGFYIDTPDGTFWDVGDSKLMDEQLRLPEPDMILFDFSDNEWHITLDGAYKLAAAYPNSELVLIHWGSVNRPDITACNANPMDLLENVINPGRVRIVAPGEPVKLKRISER